MANTARNHVMRNIGVRIVHLCVYVKIMVPVIQLMARANVHLDFLVNSVLKNVMKWESITFS